MWWPLKEFFGAHIIPCEARVVLQLSFLIPVTMGAYLGSFRRYNVDTKIQDALFHEVRARSLDTADL